MSHRKPFDPFSLEANDVVLLTQDTDTGQLGKGGWSVTEPFNIECGEPAQAISVDGHGVTFQPEDVKRIVSRGGGWSTLE